MTHRMTRDKIHAISQARAWLKQQPLFLDTETTGLRNFDEIIDLALIDSDGAVLIDTLIRPTTPIDARATAIHGITNEDIVDAPGFDEIIVNLVKLTENRLVLIYNASFDQRLLRQSAAARRLGKPFAFCQVACTMRLYTEFHGEKQPLGKAAQHLGIELPPDLHRAAADAMLCREIVEAMAAVKLPGEEYSNIPNSPEFTELNIDQQMEILSERLAGAPLFPVTHYSSDEATEEETTDD